MIRAYLNSVGWSIVLRLQIFELSACNTSSLIIQCAHLLSNNYFSNFVSYNISIYVVECCSCHSSFFNFFFAFSEFFLHILLFPLYKFVQHLCVCIVSASNRCYIRIYIEAKTYNRNNCITTSVRMI